MSTCLMRSWWWRRWWILFYKGRESLQQWAALPGTVHKKRTTKKTTHREEEYNCVYLTHRRVENEVDYTFYLYHRRIRVGHFWIEDSKDLQRTGSCQPLDAHILMFDEVWSGDFACKSCQISVLKNSRLTIPDLTQIVEEFLRKGSVIIENAIVDEQLPSADLQFVDQLALLKATRETRNLDLRYLSRHLRVSSQTSNVKR